MAEAVEVGVLGELAVVGDGGTALAVRGVKARTLLTVLALHRGEPVAPDRLFDILWGEDLPGNPANALQALVASLRRAVGTATVTTSDAGYALGLAADAVDVVRFERLVEEGHRRLEAGDADGAAGTLHAALDLCRDEPLVEFAYAEFAVGERTRLQELVLVATEARVEADLALGRHAELVGELEVLCEHHPWRERLWELRVLALYRSGQQADALRAYADARRRLIDEFGLEPGPALRELEARVLAQDPTLDPPGARAAASASAATGPVGNIRERLTSFVGRDDEVARLLDLVDTSRIVTLIGPGGAGKTRLAVETAARLRSELADGAWLVELAGVLDLAGVGPAVVATLDASGPDPSASAVDRLAAHLQGKSLVVVLDNCEHVIAEAASVAEALAEALPDLRIIATSREALGVPGELLVPVAGLALEDAVAVFSDRAQAVRPGFAVDADTRPRVEEVCGRLDCLPLAIELAAARLRALPLDQLASLLDDRFRVLTGGARTALPRQQTLRAVVDWSYDLLFEDERKLFDRLSVFAGGWTLEAAIAVCADESLPAGEIIDVLLHLVDKSLLVADLDANGGARYSQLQTLWLYARERLAAHDDAEELRDRHARWYLDLTEGAWAGLRGKTGPEWRDRLTRDWENIRVALDRFVINRDADSALSLTERIGWVWFLRADPVEAVRWLGDALEVPGGAPELRAGVETWHAYYASWTMGPGRPLAEVMQVIDRLRGTDAIERLADALLVASELANRHGDRATFDHLMEESAVVLEELGDPWRLAAWENFVAQDAAGTGDLDTAEAAARSSIDRLRAIDESWLVFEGLGHLAFIMEARGELEEAAAMYADYVAEARSEGVPNYVLQGMTRLAGVRARQGDDETAARLYEAVSDQPIRPVNVGWILIGRAGAVRRLGDPIAARTWLEQALALYESIGLEVESSAALTSLCWWAIDAGDVDAAAAFAADARRRASVEPRSRIAAAADIAAAAAAFARTGEPADRAAFLARVDERNTAPPGRYRGLLSSSLGEHFDDADVAAFVRSLDPVQTGGR